MNVIELTSENIEQYLDDCIAAQKHLIKDTERVDADKFIQTAADSHGYLLGITTDEDRLIGMGLVSRIVDPVRVIGYVNNIIVHPDGRGQGLFAVIMDALEEQARAWGCDQMELTCSREAVQGMYEKRGYIHKDTNYYKLPL